MGKGIFSRKNIDLLVPKECAKHALYDDTIASPIACSVRELQLEAYGNPKYMITR